MLQKYAKIIRLPNVFAKILIFFLTFAPKKMKLHIFNPEHDLAMASGLANFTAPHAGRRLRADLGWLPALWAADDDCVLVENASLARRAFSRLRARAGGFASADGPAASMSGPRFVEVRELAALGVEAVEPWGWDAALRAFLLRHGVEAVPSEQEIAAIRDLSHRRHAASLLEKLRDTLGDTMGTDPTVSSAADYRGSVPSVSLRALPAACESLSEVETHLSALGRIVVKAPWSSSGRGVRFVSGVLDAQTAGWIRHVIGRQGSVMVEPYYNKVRDFGMEFESLGGGQVRYLGLSLFSTRGGAYTGNIIATEEQKRAMLARYVAPERLDAVALAACRGLAEIIGDRYRGSLGVDMMIVDQRDRSRDSLGTSDHGPVPLIHPCVEINLRRTMGHAALAIPPHPDGRPRAMLVDPAPDRYRFRLRTLR